MTEISPERQAIIKQVRDYMEAIPMTNKADRAGHREKCVQILARDTVTGSGRDRDGQEQFLRDAIEGVL